MTLTLGAQEPSPPELYEADRQLMSSSIFDPMEVLRFRGAQRHIFDVIGIELDAAFDLFALLAIKQMLTALTRKKMWGSCRIEPANNAANLRPFYLEHAHIFGKRFERINTF